MSVRIFIKDLVGDRVFEYGTDNHDALVVEDGALKYINMQNGDSTPTGYAFCNHEGAEEGQLEEENFVDIGGNLTGVNCWICSNLGNREVCSSCIRDAEEKTDRFVPSNETRQVYLEMLNRASPIHVQKFDEKGASVCDCKRND